LHDKRLKGNVIWSVVYICIQYNFLYFITMVLPIERDCTFWIWIITVQYHFGYKIKNVLSILYSSQNNDVLKPTNLYEAFNAYISLAFPFFILCFSFVILWKKLYFCLLGCITCTCCGSKAADENGHWCSA
jgi:hypothetical protein